MHLPDLCERLVSKRGQNLDMGHGAGHDEEVPIEGPKRVCNFASENARTGCTSAKSELSAFGLHCPCIVKRTKRVLRREIFEILDNKKLGRPRGIKI